MAKWHVGCVVDGAKFAALMELLIPLKVESLEFKIVAGTPTRIRAGDKPAWEMVMAAALDKPMPRGHFVSALEKVGFSKPAVSSGIDQAVRKRLLHKQKIKGVNHYRRSK